MTYRLFEPTLARADGHKQRLIGIVSDYGENLVAKSDARVIMSTCPFVTG